MPESEKEIDDKIKEYDGKIQHAIKELSRTNQAGEIKKLEGKNFSGEAGSVPVHSRIPTSFSVDLNYEAVAGKGLDKEKFENKPGTPTTSHGTITVSNATPETVLIVEEKAPKRDTSKGSGKKEEEAAAAKATGKKEQRFMTSFAITQA